MERLILNGIVREDATLSLPLAGQIKDWCVKNIGNNVKLTIERRRKSRSTKQNAYYWGVIVPLIREGIQELGHILSEEETHEFLKKEFNNQEVNLENGYFLNVPGSTTDMTTVDFMKFKEKVQHFAATILGIVIPEPNEQVKIDFEK